MNHATVISISMYTVDLCTLTSLLLYSRKRIIEVTQLDWYNIACHPDYSSSLFGSVLCTNMYLLAILIVYRTKFVRNFFNLFNSFWHLWFDRKSFSLWLFLKLFHREKWAGVEGCNTRLKIRHLVQYFC